MYQSKRFSRKKHHVSALGSLFSAIEEAADDTQCVVPSGKPFCLSRCIRFLLSKAGYILAFALVCTLLFFFVFQLIPPRYKATSKLYLLGTDESGLQLTTLQAGTLLLADYSEVLKTWEVHEAVRTQLELDLSYNEMQEMLSVYTPAGSHLLYITITHSDPALAAELANAYASAAHSFIVHELHGLQPGLFSSAIIPSHISGLSLYGWLLLVFIAGAASMTGIYTIRFCLDDRIYSEEDLQLAANAAVLASIPVQIPDKAPSKEKETLYLLASRIITMQKRCILFSAPHNAQGVSLVCTGLVHALGKLHQRALWICVEYVHSQDRQASPAIEDYLQERCSWQQLLQIHQNVALLSIQGTELSLPSRLFHPRMAVLMQELQSVFDWILIDVPPADRQVAASAFYACCDGCILVCANGQSTFRDITAYMACLSESGKPLLGTVLNNRPSKAGLKAS